VRRPYSRARTAGFARFKRLCQMSIRTRIRAFQILVGLAVVLIALISLVGIRSSANAINEVEVSRLQLDAVTRLAINANRFSEQIAELLLVGEPERADFLSSRNDIGVAFENLKQLLRQEIDLTGGAESPELERVEQLEALFREIDRAVERVLLLDQEGRRDEGIALFRAEVENRLDADLERLIAAAVADERAGVERVQANANRLADRLTVVTLVLSAILILLVVGAGVVFAQSLQTPINALAAGAQAIERGEFDHRIGTMRGDEFGLLAKRFNAMAAEIQSQREALIEARVDLERQVVERTQEIATANRQLTVLDTDRARFIADVSHELRTPLTILRGEAEVTLRGAAKPEEAYRAALSRIADQAAAMGRLVDDLLFLGRSEADQIRFEFRQATLGDIVAEAVEDATALARDKRVGFVVETDGDAPAVRADPRRLKQALLIVLDNAARYGDSKTGVEVRISRVDGEAEIRIRDHGHGVPRAEVGQVFDRFFRGSNARAETGSGLGLPIARWIVEKHRGRIDLSAAPGGGTEVRIALPAA
jgi:two-component system OmpR family sensor kinase